jgi:hypothetical protein
MTKPLPRLRPFSRPGRLLGAIAAALTWAWWPLGWPPYGWAAAGTGPVRRAGPGRGTAGRAGLAQWPSGPGYRARTAEPRP